MFQEPSKNFTTKNSSIKPDKKVSFFLVFFIFLVIATLLTFYRVYVKEDIKYFTNEEDVSDFNPFSFHEYY